MTSKMFLDPVEWNRCHLANMTEDLFPVLASSLCRFIYGSVCSVCPSLVWTPHGPVIVILCLSVLVSPIYRCFLRAATCIINFLLYAL